MELYTLEEVPGKSKKVRVIWDTDEYEYDEPSEHHYSMRDRQIDGIGEDESEWSMGISIEEHGDSFEIDYPAEFIKEKASISPRIRIVDNKRHYVDRYWNENGKLVIPSGSLSKKVSVKDYFNATLGEYPNIDPKKGPLWLELQDLRKDAKIMLLSLMNQIPVDKIEKTAGPKTEFIHVPKIINGKETIVTVPTNYGLAVNLLKSNNINWQNQISPDGILYGDAKALKRRVVNFLL